MPEQTPARPTSQTEADPTLRRLREYVAAAISAIIILGAVIMMIQAFNYLGSPEEFARVKDMLLFINPLLGVVIGYYFNKVTSEARAETAESTAQNAMTTAQQATEGRNQAEAEASTAKSEAKEAKSALKEVGQAVEKMTAETAAATPGVLSVDELGKPVVDPRLELQMAWSRARHLVE